MTAPTTLTFLGAAGTVTGSRFLLRHAGSVVLVDCGMFQGRRALRELNWAAPSFEAAQVDAVVLTHAHLDHVGWLPVLMRFGFAGRVIAATWTPELARIVLSDSGHLQEEEAAFATRRGYSRHDPVLPLYTQAEAEEAASRIAGTSLGSSVEVAEGITATFRPAGHILGSAIVELDLDGGPRLLFSGDLGRPHHPILVPPARPDACEVLVVESTYGDRRHEDMGDALERLAGAVTATAKRGGTVIIPAFAVDRTEVLLCALGELEAAGRIPELPVYVDSPMASAVLGAYHRAIASNDPEIRQGADLTRGLAVGGGLRESSTRDESIAIDALNTPSIVISSSGMATGGRVLHHLARRLPDARSTVVLAGYQAEGTRGRELADGARSVKLHGRYVPVKAEIVTVDAFSVHADGDELVAWMGAQETAPHTTFVVHGEPASSEALVRRIGSDLGRMGVAPTSGETVVLA